MPHDKWMERIKRSHEAGKQIHAQNLAEQERILREQEAESNIIEFENPNSDAEGVAEGRIVSYEPLSGEDERANESLDDFGIQPESV